MGTYVTLLDTSANRTFDLGKSYDFVRLLDHGEWLEQSGDGYLHRTTIPNPAFWREAGFMIFMNELEELHVSQRQSMGAFADTSTLDAPESFLLPWAFIVTSCGPIEVLYDPDYLREWRCVGDIDYNCAVTLSRHHRYDLLVTDTAMLNAVSAGATELAGRRMVAKIMPIPEDVFAHMAALEDIELQKQRRGVQVRYNERVPSEELLREHMSLPDGTVLLQCEVVYDHPSYLDNRRSARCLAVIPED